MSTGGNAAQTLTEKVKGAANLAHGSGESLRGNINSFVDNLGSQGQNATNSGTTGTGNDVKDLEKDVENRATSSKGKEEMQSGLNAFQK